MRKPTKTSQTITKVPAHRAPPKRTKPIKTTKSTPRGKVSGRR